MPVNGLGVRGNGKIVFVHRAASLAYTVKNNKRDLVSNKAKSQD